MLKCGQEIHWTMRLRYYLAFSISVPLAIMLLLLQPFLKVRLVRLFSHRIGSFALTTELALCALEMNLQYKKNKYMFYISGFSLPLSNHQLYRMWKRSVAIMPCPMIAYQVDRLLGIALGGKYEKDLVKLSCETDVGAIDTNGFLEKIKKPHLHFTAAEELHGKRMLTKLGIPAGAPFVCLIVRDSAYLAKTFAAIRKTLDNLNNFRDANIVNYEKAALFLANKGYYVIRMGKIVDKSFAVQHPRVVDYANHTLRSDFLDIYLPAHCCFFISTAVGLETIAHIFRKPVVYTNVFLPGELTTTYPGVLFIPKKVVHKITQHVLTFREVYEIFTSDCQVMNMLVKHNLSIIENTEDEILEAIREMEMRMAGLWVDQIGDEVLQQQFWAQFPMRLKTDNGVPKFPKDVKVKIGVDFLRKNSSLINSVL